MESKYITSKEILRPPQYGIPASPVTTSPPPRPQSDFVNEEGDESLTHKVLEQEEEIKELKSEVKKLRQCIKGVHVIGRELQKSKEENRRLMTSVSVSDDSNKQEAVENLNDDEDKDTAVTEQAVQVADDDNSASSSSEESSDEDERSSSEASSSDSNTEDELDDLDDDVDTDEEEEVKYSTSVKRKRKTRCKVKSAKDNHHLREEIAQLQAENKELKEAREAETSNAFHYVTSTEANELQQKTDSNVNEGVKSSIGLDTGDLGWEKRYKELEIENTELKATVKEIKKVNHKWDQFWNDKKTDYDTKMKEKDGETSTLRDVIVEKDQEIQALRDRLEKENNEHDATICKMERVLEVEADDKERVLQEKEELLLMAKQRIDNTEAQNEELRREMSKEQQKCDRAQKFARNLLKQKKEHESEIKRLNGTLTEKCEEHSLLKSIDPKVTGTAEVQLSVTEESHRRPSPPLSPSHMRRMEQELLGEVLERKVYDCRQRNAAPMVDQQVLLMTEGERSMTKDELKEKVELFREQTEAYESDFRRERRDREAVVGQLDSVKKELRQAKAMLHNGPKPPTFTHRLKDKPLHKDPLRHELPEYRRPVAAPQRHYYPNKRDNLIAHGHGGSSKPKERSPSRPRREHNYYQHRHLDDYREYEREVVDDEDERYHVCRCPKHDCYVPVGQPMNNLSKTNGAC